MKFKKKYAYIFVLLVFIQNMGFAKGHILDSLRHALSIEKEDTNKINTLVILAYYLHYNKPDSTIFYAREAGALAAKLGWEKGAAQAYATEALAIYVKGDYKNALTMFMKAVKIAQEVGDKYVLANILTNTGNVYKDQGDYAQALDYYMKALKLKEEIGNKLAQASTLGNIGIVYDEQGDYPKALEFHLKSLKIAEEVGSKSIQSSALCNIGSVYYEQNEYTKALDYYSRALKIDEEIGDKQGQSIAIGNIGSTYKDMAGLAQSKQEINKSDSLYKNALENDLKAIEIAEEIKNIQIQATFTSDVGEVYYGKANLARSQHNFTGSDSLYAKALTYYLKALKINEEIGNKPGNAGILRNIGALYAETGKYKESEEYLKQAIALDSSIGELNDLRKGEILISQLYDSAGQYKPALAWYKKAMILKDSLFNIDKNKALTRKEMTFEFEKKEASEKAEQEIKDTRQRIIVWSVLSGLLLVIVFAGFIFRSLNITRKQKVLIERQKLLVEEKNKDILDSINYAKRLQDAILPPISEVKKVLPESFVLYNPKDIVAGDFYWLEKVTHPSIPSLSDREGGSHANDKGVSMNGDTILIAAADCTGHGVPGALVSVVCSNALNRTVKEFKITEPGKILDKVRELVLETFEKSEDNVQDGMDISLAAITASLPSKGGFEESSSDKNTNLVHGSPLGSGGAVTVQWAGANNSLWYMQNNEMKEVNPDKQPIGKYYDAKPFATRTLELKKDDVVYLFTDGYADQFGGPKGKKFKYAQMQLLMIDNAQLKMEEQKSVLEKKFEEWKGNLEQVDDVLIIGIRV